MEDAHAAVLELDPSSNDKNTFFAVYDGHGGTIFPIFTSLSMSGKPINSIMPFFFQAQPSPSTLEDISINVLSKKIHIITKTMQKLSNKRS
jgi:serine/threonine protein phosphatase PrpC